MKTPFQKYCIFFFTLFAFYFSAKKAIAQNDPYPKAANIELFGSTRGFFIAPSFSFSKNKHRPTLGLLLGRHHTLNGIGLGLNIGDRYYPNKKKHPLNLFFISSAQFIVFTNPSSPSLKSIFNFQLSGGYGVDYKVNSRLSLLTYFSLGFLLELRTFVPNFNNYGSLDSAGLLSFGMTYLLGEYE